MQAVQSLYTNCRNYARANALSEEFITIAQV